MVPSPSSSGLGTSAGTLGLLAFALFGPCVPVLGPIPCPLLGWFPRLVPSTVCNHNQGPDRNSGCEAIPPVAGCPPPPLSRGSTVEPGRWPGGGVRTWPLLRLGFCPTERGAGWVR